MPTKTFPTLAAVAWLKQIVLPDIDHLEMNHLLLDLEHIQQRLKELEKVIAQRLGSKTGSGDTVNDTRHGPRFYRHGFGLPDRAC
jgi:hypothetical protein